MFSHELTGYHYDSETEECDLVYYDERTKNENLFESLDSCLDFCLPPATTTDYVNPEANTPTTVRPPSTTTEKATTPKPQKLNRNQVLAFNECSTQPFAGYCR